MERPEDTVASSGVVACSEPSAINRTTCSVMSDTTPPLGSSFEHRETAVPDEILKLFAIGHMVRMVACVRTLLFLNVWWRC